MALPPIQSTTMLGQSLRSPEVEFYVWVEIEEMRDGQHYADHDWGYGKVGTYTTLKDAQDRAEFVEWLVGSVRYETSPDGLHYWVARARL